MRRLLLEHKAHDANEVVSPWPAPDLERAPGTGASWIWDPYSAEQQRARVEAVYGAALRAYSEVVDEWFPQLKMRMRVATTLPAVLRGRLTPSVPSPMNMSALDASTTPTMVWYLDPLAYSETSRASVVIANDPDAVPRRGEMTGGAR
jgi:hypothetical protein